MKAATHPVYNEITVKCACGHTYETRSTREEMKVDICGACHPFYTGQQRMLDTEGRVERFKKKYEKKK
jgi:large subunit ribosomal protein L31